MTSPNTPDLGSTSVKWRWPSVHPEGRKFVLIAAVITLIFALVAWETLAWPMAGITVWVAAFFRDPIRTAPLGDGLVIAPADGLITMIVTVPPPKEMAGEDGLGDGPMTRVSIFMSVFDVHINRAPIAGTIKRIAYIAGKFLNADLDKASEENERQHILVEATDGTRIGFTQIAGLVARRIVPFVTVGETVGLGQRVGLIRFGSRVDVFLPAGTGHRVTVGQRTIAGETVIAKLGEGERTVGTAQ
ncbi:phosphatidylserine decarboxylase [Sphingomonas sp. YR710]|uniref:phosphatidylserine decarboxylase n=1 Tax=Sphingomonas sp. YR710 TaxID=1882773 RepID=UPI000882115F|nr:phosphatidylserine decarboxylase [Sphingomonas sp. YR710]SDC62878.1 phosphatidylserine decarboxylase [Sphingomonas sp. YR710]